MDLVKTGITENTPKQILFGAGTVFRNLTYDKTSSGWKYDSVLCATKGGSKYTLQPTHLPMEIDGMLVAVEGMDAITDFVAKMEINVGEYSQDVIKDALHATEETSESTDYVKLKPSADLTEGAYLENLGFVGFDTGGKPCIVIFDSAICTSGMEVDNQPKTQGSFAVTYEARGKVTSLDEIPVTLYLPNRS